MVKQLQECIKTHKKVKLILDKTIPTQSPLTSFFLIFLEESVNPSPWQLRKLCWRLHDKGWKLRKRPGGGRWVEMVLSEKMLEKTIWLTFNLIGGDVPKSQLIDVAYCTD